MLCSYRTPENRCLACSTCLDSCASAFGRHKPKPGDFTICIKCSHLMVFADDLTVRELNGEEIREAAGSKAILAVMAALGETRAEKRQ